RHGREFACSRRGEWTGSEFSCRAPHRVARPRALHVAPPTSTVARAAWPCGESATTDYCGQRRVMTLRVRKGYRSHRKTTWALGVALVALIATVAIPFALAATSATKYYTLIPTPNPVCASTTDGAASTVVALKNTAGSQTLGSA